LLEVRLEPLQPKHTRQQLAEAAALLDPSGGISILKLLLLIAVGCAHLNTAKVVFAVQDSSRLFSYQNRK